MNIVKTAALVGGFLLLAACQTDGDFAYLENADGSCKFGYIPNTNFCAAEDGRADPR